MVEHLLLTKAGYFEIGTVTGNDRFQCGAQGERRIRYHVSITGLPERLSKEGFVLNNHAIQEYFDVKYKVVDTLPSCERIAITACEDLAKIAGCPVRVEVTVGGVPNAGLTAFWQPDTGSGLGCLLPRQNLGEEEPSLVEVQ